MSLRYPALGFDADDSMKSASAVIVAVVLLVQFALVSYTFPLTELLSDKPLLHIDAAFHLYQAELARTFAQDGNIVGYDPYFAGGYAAGATQNLSARFAALLAVVLAPWASAEVAYKLHSFLGALLAIACAPLAARILRCNARTVLCAAIIGLLLWWVSVFRWYHTAGMVSFVTAAYFALPYLALVVRYLEGTPILSPLGLGVLGAFGFFYHPLFPIAVALGTVVYLALSFGELPARRVAMVLIAVPAISVAPNLVWIVPAHEYNSFISTASNAPPHQQVVDVNLIWRELSGRWGDGAQGSKTYLPILVLACWGWMVSGKERWWTQTFTLTGILLVIFAALGSAIPALGENLQPNRFAPVGNLMMAPAAAFAAAHIASRLTMFSWRTSLAGGMLLVFAAWPMVELAREISYRDIGHYGALPPQVKGLGDKSRWLISRLKEQTDSSARVLFETSNGRFHDGGHMAGYYAFASQREFIGGPYPFLDYPSFWDGVLLHRPVSTISAEDFERIADLYNIGWMVLHHAESKTHLGTMPGAELAGEFGGLEFYRLRRDPSYFVEGEGQVVARGHNRLELGNLRGDSVVLKYHYLPGIASSPRATIEPIHLGDDPTPFIRLINPPRELMLHLP